MLERDLAVSVAVYGLVVLSVLLVFLLGGLGAVLVMTVLADFVLRRIAGARPAGAQAVEVDRSRRKL